MTRMQTVFMFSAALVMLSVLAPTPSHTVDPQTMITGDHVDEPTVSLALLLARFDQMALPPPAPPEIKVPEPTVVAPPSSPLERSVIRGLIQSDNASLVLLDHRGRLVTLREGDVFLGYTLASIDAYVVRFNNDTDQVTLRLSAGVP